MSTYAQLQDVETAWGQPIPPDAASQLLYVQGLLDEAETELELDPRIGSVAARLTAGVTTTERVRSAVVNMVLRVLRNPNGFRQQSAGPFSYTVDRSVASGKLTVTNRERRLLGALTGAGSVSLSAGDDALRHPFRPVEDWQTWQGQRP